MTMDEQKYVSPTQLNELRHQQPAPLIVDVRDAQEYEAGHVAGARNIPADELLQVLLEPPLNRNIIVYCNMKHPGSSRSEKAAEQLRQSGYTARALMGGFPAWQEAGYPVATGFDSMEHGE